jgi:hypothetical protein
MTTELVRETLNPNARPVPFLHLTDTRVECVVSLRFSHGRFSFPAHLRHHGVQETHGRSITGGVFAFMAKKKRKGRRMGFFFLQALVRFPARH